MNTKKAADKALDSAYGGTVDRLRAQREARNGAATHRDLSIVTPKPGGESHFAQLQRESQEQQAENDKAMAAAIERRQAADALEQLKAQKQEQWLQAGGTVAEFRASWPELRRQHLIGKVSGE